MSKKILKKGNLYFPSSELKKSTWVNNKSIYKKAEKNPIGFWKKLAKDLKWSKQWKKTFSQNPPYFEWFGGGKINITENALDENLKQRRCKVAFIWEPEPAGESPRIFTYYELSREVNRFANALKKMGVKKGDRVGIYLPVIPEVIISMLACARIGAVHAVVFSAFSPSALKIRLQDTDAKVLITADGYFRRGKIIDLKKNADEGVKETKVEKVIVVKRLSSVIESEVSAPNHTAVSEGEKGSLRISWQKDRDFWWQDLVKEESDWCESRAMDSEDLLFILYTSGSTGRPKGCEHVCGGYAVQAKWTGKWIFDWKDEDVFWSTADIGWITGHTYSCYAPLLNGVTFLIFEGAPDWPSPDRWCQIIERYGVSIFYTAPTAIRMFEKYGTDLVRKYKFKTLRLLGSVGEPIDEAAWKWYFREVGKGRCPIVDTWWQTETGGVLITSLPGLGPFNPSFTGLPFPGVKTDILDEQGRSLKAGKEGNLVILPPFAPGLLRGIYKNPKKYLETYWSQYGKEIYFTSDAAYKDETGLIRIVGRVDDAIKVAGHRITTGELEAAINLHPEITECAVVGIPDEIKGEVPVVFAVSSLAKSTEGGENLKKEVIGQIRKEIGPMALPKEVYLVEDLPKTRSGKIMRRILKRMFTGEEIGDLSTLANPQIVEAIKHLLQK